MKSTNYLNIRCNDTMDIAVEIHYCRPERSQMKMEKKGNVTRVYYERPKNKDRKKVIIMGIIKGVALTAMMMATVMSSVTPAFAVTPSMVESHNDYVESRSEMYGLSKEEVMKSVSNSIQNVRNMINRGEVNESDLFALSEKIYSLEKYKDAFTQDDLIDLSEILNDADSLVKDINTKGADAVKVATAVVRATLGIQTDSYSVKNNKASAVTSFSDVPSTHWAYDAIMTMTKMGLINGTTTPVNGVGTFAPDKTMTRAEFTAIIVRAMYPEDVAKAVKIEGAAWWQSSYEIAVNHNLLSINEFDRGDMNKECSRQEMSMLLVRAYEQEGNTVSKLVDTSRIADWNTIGTYYRDYVRKAYSLGLLVGVDSVGTFAPQNTLSRCQAATVIYRLLDESTRQKVDFSPVVKTDSTTYNEGQTRSNMPAVGDTVIKADGTKVVLEEKWGVLGAGQGVDIYSGVIYDGSPRQVGNIWTDDSALFADYRGEVHSGYQWASLKSATAPTYQGKDGEIYNNWWQYEAGWGWSWIGPHGD